jgi:deoxycytidylate deaminase
VVGTNAFNGTVREKIEHAERTAIYSATRRNASLMNTTAYIPWFPCVDCARALAEVGVIRLVCEEPNWEETRYSFREAAEVLRDAGVQVDYAKAVVVVEGLKTDLLIEEAKLAAAVKIGGDQ